MLIDLAFQQSSQAEMEVSGRFIDFGQNGFHAMFCPFLWQNPWAELDAKRTQKPSKRTQKLAKARKTKRPLYFVILKV